ncbi:DNA polymerase III subunit delta' C-terminal domain-containing protein [Pantoea sp. SoEX]|uniref:DNA polymerase III subunit delta' C-terminal domain-containing protein n=1 Tax=Pantoea sp. SoEX TaxID=2576763 RepID=UPI0013578CA9|nr:DNA polymerase III subunit delta' C-terminal domain-containing protein [Pantoea sp. SoEX]MXP50998.1 DNA polymerase III subunit delta' [Pantoea sp. SoEX]
MEWYPWLNKPYYKIINQYREGFSHPVLLIQGNQGIGKDSLLWKLSYWLLCKMPVNLDFCGSCNSCRLMKVNTHPDYYLFNAKNASIDMVRNLISNLYTCSHTSNRKVTCILDVDHLTKYSSNALLKIIEEPPSNSLFFLSTQNFSTVPLTIRSRCVMFRLFPPSEEDSILWIKQKCLQKDESIIVSSLRLSNGMPTKALNLITTSLLLRKKLYDTLCFSLKQDILQLLPIICENEMICIDWLISLILDAMKLQNNITEQLINIDRKDVISLLANSFSFDTLNNSMYHWIKCRNTLINVTEVNKELLLINSLLIWVENSISG